MSQSRTAGAFLGSPYQKVEYLIGRENGSTKVGLTSSVAGYHGTWVHPSPGTALELNVIVIGSAGGASVDSFGDGADGTKTIFGLLTANAGTGGRISPNSTGVGLISGGVYGAIGAGYAPTVINSGFPLNMGGGMLRVRCRRLCIDIVS